MTEGGTQYPAITPGRISRRVPHFGARRTVTSGPRAQDFRNTILTYGRLETFDADKGIDDKAWLADPRKPADYEHPISDDAVAIGDDEFALFEVPG